MERRIRLIGEHLTHEILWGTAKRFLATGVEQPRGSFYSSLAAVVFGCFAFEAYLNAALEEVAPGAWKDERNFFVQARYRGTLGKFEYLAELCGHTVDKSRRPFQTVRKLSEVRNFLAHAPVEHFDVKVPVKKLEELQPHPSVLHVYACPKFAAKALADVEALLDGLQVALVARFDDIRIGSTVGAFSAIEGLWAASLVEEEQPRMSNKAMRSASHSGYKAKSQKGSRAARRT